MASVNDCRQQQFASLVNLDSESGESACPSEIFPTCFMAIVDVADCTREHVEVNIDKVGRKAFIIAFRDEEHQECCFFKELSLPSTVRTDLISAKFNAGKVNLHLPSIDPKLVESGIPLPIYSVNPFRPLKPATSLGAKSCTNLAGACSSTCRLTPAKSLSSLKVELGTGKQSTNRVRFEDTPPFDKPIKSYLSTSPFYGRPISQVSERKFTKSSWSKPLEHEPKQSSIRKTFFGDPTEYQKVYQSKVKPTDESSSWKKDDLSHFGKINQKFDEIRKETESTVQKPKEDPPKTPIARPRKHSLIRKDEPMTRSKSIERIIPIELTNTDYFSNGGNPNASVNFSANQTQYNGRKNESEQYIPIRVQKDRDISGKSDYEFKETFFKETIIEYFESNL